MAQRSSCDATGGPVVKTRIRHAERRDAGFTLIETIVALAVLATVMTAVFAALILQQRSFAVQSDRAEMRIRLKRGFEILEREFRNAGGGIPLGVPLPLPAGWDGRSPAFLVSGMRLYEGGTDGPDALVVAHALSPPVFLTRGMETGSSDLAVEAGIRWEPGMLGIISDGRNAEFFRVTRIDGGTLLQHAGGGIFPPCLSKPYSEGSSVSPVRLAGYSGSTSGRSGHAALVYRGIDRDGNLIVRTVAEGIEDLQLGLMMPGGSDRDAERQVVDPATDSPVVGVRIRMVSRSRLSGDPHPMVLDAVVGLRNRGSSG